jgi:hypothetical protein
MSQHEQSSYLLFGGMNLYDSLASECTEAYGTRARLRDIGHLLVSKRGRREGFSP